MADLNLKERAKELLTNFQDLYNHGREFKVNDGTIDAVEIALKARDKLAESAKNLSTGNLNTHAVAYRDSAVDATINLLKESKLSQEQKNEVYSIFNQNKISISTGKGLTNTSDLDRLNDNFITGLRQKLNELLPEQYKTIDKITRDFGNAYDCNDAKNKILSLKERAHEAGNNIETFFQGLPVHANYAHFAGNAITGRTVLETTLKHMNESSLTSINLRNVRSDDHPKEAPLNVSKIEDSVFQVSQSAYRLRLNLQHGALNDFNKAYNTLQQEMGIMPGSPSNSKA